MSYRGKVKNGNNNCKARENVEHIFGDGFEHYPPPWRTLIRPNEHLNWAFLDKRQNRAVILRCTLVAAQERLQRSYLQVFCRIAWR
jgi:hypothetical protein